METISIITFSVSIFALPITGVWLIINLFRKKSPKFPLIVAALCYILIALSIDTSIATKLFLISALGLLASIIWLIITAIKKQEVKTPLKGIVTCFVLTAIFFCVSLSQTPIDVQNIQEEVTTASKIEDSTTKEEKTPQKKESSKKSTDKKKASTQNDSTAKTESKKTDEPKESNDSDKNDQSESIKTKAGTTSSVSNTEKPEDKFVVDFAKDIGQSYAEHVASILRNDIGFIKLEYVGKLGGTSNYQIKADGIDVVITAYNDDSTDEYLRIFTPDNGGVYYENNTVTMTAEEKKASTIDYNDAISYYVIATGIVQENLKNPSSASFDDFYSGKIKMNKKDDVVTVQGNVVAKNSFNAKTTETWTVQFIPTDLETFSYQLVYLQIGNNATGTLYN